MHDSIPSSSGIYKITCTANKKIYIGSAINLRQRKRNHFNTLRRNVHHNQHLQNAWNKYGEQAFIFEILEFVLEINCTAREQYWLNKLKPFGKKGFNIAYDTVHSGLGSKRSEATRQKMRESQLGKKASEETLSKLRESHKGQKGWMKGKTPSEETCRKISKTLTGRKNPKSEEARRHSSEVRIGKPHPHKKRNPYGPDEKLCPKCNEVKSINDFYIRREGKTIRTRSHCKECMKKAEKG